MNNIELLQNIGNEICEGCGPDSDCGEKPEDCFRIQNASMWLNDFLSDFLSDKSVTEK